MAVKKIMDIDDLIKIDTTKVTVIEVSFAITLTVMILKENDWK